MDIPIIVLAAGASRRMRGSDKLLELVEDRPLVRRQAEIARAATEASVVVALPPRPHARYDALAGLDVTLLEVPEAAEGMGASLRTAFAALPPDTQAAMLVLADLPEMAESDLQTIFQAYANAPEYLIWRGATDTGKPGHPVIFHRTLFPQIARLKGDTGGQEVVVAAGDKVVLVPLPGNRARLDLDTPEDWAAWRSGQQKTGR